MCVCVILRGKMALARVVSLIFTHRIRLGTLLLEVVRDVAPPGGAHMGGPRILQASSLGIWLSPSGLVAIYLHFSPLPVAPSF